MRHHQRPGEGKFRIRPCIVARTEKVALFRSGLRYRAAMPRRVAGACRAARVGLLACLGLTAVLTGPLGAQEKDLSDGHPVRIEDAFFVASGDGALLVTGGALRPHDGPTHGLFAVDLQYAPLPRLQLALATVLSTVPDQMRDPASGDLNVSARVWLAPETGILPSLAAHLAATVPTGDGSRALDLELKGFATRSVVPGLLPLFLHLNVSLETRATEKASDERRVRFHTALGVSLTVPHHAPLTLVADVYADQAFRRAESTTVGLEFGARYRLGPATAVHAAVGTEVAGPSGRAALLARFGFSVGFSGPAIGGAP